MLLDKKVVARDRRIFQDDGLIFIPRSDGHAAHKPSAEQQQPPGPHDETYEYRKICGPGDKYFQAFLEKSGQMLAVDIFGLAKDRKWRLAGLPANYTYTMNIRKPYSAQQPNKIRHDMYVYGQGTCFRSSHEILPHLAWLLLDPAMKRGNCKCKYCHGGDEWKKVGDKSKARMHGKTKEEADADAKRKSSPTSVDDDDRSTRKKKDSKVPKDRPTKRQKVEVGRAGTRNENTFDIRVQRSVEQLPGVPIVSKATRDRDLRMVEKSSITGHEGFREGEYVFYTLKKKIIDATEPENVIAKWPAYVKGVTFEAVVSPQKANTPADEFDLTGRVRQKRKYTIVLLGTDEGLCVSEDQLSPMLANKVGKQSIEKGEASTKERDAYMRTGLVYDQETLNLESDRPRASQERLEMAYEKALAALAEIRCHYVTTDSFRREGEKPEPVEPFNRERKDDGNDDDGDDDMDIDDSQRIEEAPRVPPIRRPSAQHETGTGLINDTNKYWQGIYLGSERIWIGDLVRLRLTPLDAKDTFNALRKAKKLFRREDAKKPDLRTPFVLRVKAIYRAADVRSSETDDGIRVAGDLFRVVEVPSASANVDRYRKESMTSSGTSDETLTNDEEGAGDILPNDSGDGSNESEEGGTDGEGSEGEEHAAKTDVKPRPTFPVPARPFLEATPQGRLPETQRLPIGYGFQRVNQASTEVVFCVQHVAGRLYCSLAGKCAPASSPNGSFTSLKQMVRHHRAQYTEADENTADVERARLSLAGLLSGCVQSMGIHTYMGRCFTRKAFEEQAFERARQFEERALQAIECQMQNSSLTEHPTQTLPPGWKWKWSNTQLKHYMVDLRGRGHWKLPKDLTV